MRHVLHYCLMLATAVAAVTVFAEEPHISREAIEWCNIWIPDANGTKLPRVLDQCRFDVVHFNNGLHGWGYSEAEYRKHFPQLVATIREHAPKAKLIWAATTPMRKAGDLTVVAEGTNRVKARNQIAEEFVAREGIAVDDLYGLVQDHLEYWSADGVHFNGKGIDVQAEQVSRRIAENLK